MVGPLLCHRKGLPLSLVLLGMLFAPLIFAEEGTEGIASVERAELKKCKRGQSKIDLAMRQKNWVDAHLMAEVVDVFCDDMKLKPWKISNAISLIRLDDGESAREILREEMQHGREKSKAALVYSWSYLKNGDQFAFERSLKNVAFEDVSRLKTVNFIGHPKKIDVMLKKNSSSNTAQVLSFHQKVLDSQNKNLWVSGLLSTVLPGAGQVYSGSWDAAAISFVLNVILIGATVELIRDEKYFSASATGTVASMFYLGNILNAIDLSKRRNKQSSRPHRESIEALLLPEIYPSP